MKKEPYWLDTAKIKSFPALNRDISVDVLVIGAGITGITAAYLLKQSGLTVALIERDRVAIRDTGHTTAHLTYVTDTGLTTLEKKFGADQAQAVWDAGAAAIDAIEAIVVREAIDCEFARVPGYLHAPIDCDWKDEEQDLKKVRAWRNNSLLTQHFSNQFRTSVSPEFSSPIRQDFIPENISRG